MRGKPASLFRSPVSTGGGVTPQYVEDAVAPLRPPTNAIPIYASDDTEIVDGQTYAFRASIRDDGALVFMPAQGPKLRVTAPSIIVYGTDKQPELLEIEEIRRESVASLLASTRSYPVGATLVAGLARYVVLAADAAAGDVDLVTAGGVNLRVLQRPEGYNPLDFGAKWDGVSDDSIPIKKAIAAAERNIEMIETSVGSGVFKGSKDGPMYGVILPPGKTCANGLLVRRGRVHIRSTGCLIRSFAAQSAESWILQFGTAIGEDGHIYNNSIEGVEFNGRNHANVGGLKTFGCSHLHRDRVGFRNFSGVGTPGAVYEYESYDCTWSRSLVMYSGRAGSSLETATPAMTVMSSLSDACNQLIYDGITWEQNAGIDLAILAPAGNAYPSGSIVIRGKFEQGGSQTNYAAIYAPESLRGIVHIDGKCEFNGYHRDGGAVIVKMGLGGQLVIDPAAEFNYKPDQIPAGAQGAAVKFSGLGRLLIGGRISADRADKQVFLDSTGVDPMQIVFSNITTDAEQRGFLWTTRDGTSSRVKIDQGRVRYALKLAPDAMEVFTPRGEAGILNIATHDRPTACGVIGYRADLASGAASIAALGVGPDLELGTGTLVHNSTATTANKVHVRTHTDGRVYVQNRYTFTLVVHLEPVPTASF